MEMLALTCPQCGSSDVKLIPERNDLAQCNYCNALFMLPAPPARQAEEPQITATQQEEEEEEDVDMTEVVYPVKPAPPFAQGLLFVLAGGWVVASVICGLIAFNQLDPDPEKIAACGGMLLFGLIAFLLVIDRQVGYEKSEEMKEYIKERRAAVDKSWAQLRQRERQKKRSGIKMK
ncbi:hypothetical protein [Chitinophaga sp. Cy-1792]|uniref:hypothetical protein n=1 Tax=Chitinophaga sp. Cy-1792 TaxID=2608339 RepID=UPI0014213082|nr:hypothetical protein [Chitinophaga sp. Cy-1792]NIG57619.1 hypothetical protein [Chitinophaga sp. Cy-1792]